MRVLPARDGRALKEENVMMKRKPKRLRRSRRELRLRKALSWMLIFILTAPLCSAAFVHATQTDPGLCEHHPEHTPDCVYAEAG